MATDIRHLDGGAVLELTGVLDRSTLPILQQGLRPLTYRYDADQLTIDCKALDFIDAGGLRHLVQLSKAMGPGRVKIVEPPPLLRALLAVTGADEVFEVAPQIPAGPTA